MRHGSTLVSTRCAPSLLSAENKAWIASLRLERSGLRHRIGESQKRDRRRDLELAVCLSKAAVRCCAQRSQGVKKLTVISLRIFNDYAAGFSSSIAYCLAMGRGKPPLVHDTERFVRDYIHASDVARAFALGLEAPGSESAIFNVGTGIGTTNRTLLELCSQAVYRASGKPDVASFSVADT